MSRQQISNADAAWLHMDRPTNLMIITSVVWFDRPVDWTRVREVLAERFVGPYVRFSQRAIESRLPLRGPHWEDDPAFDLDRHLHRLALPAPGGDAELQELVSDLMATPLDRSKPLWDMYFVDGYRGGAAMVSRIHHSIADGIALARVLLSLTDEQPDAGIVPATDPAPGRRGPAVVQAVGQAVGRAAGAVLHEELELVRHPSEVGHIAGEAAKDARSLRKLLLMNSDRKTVLKGEMGATRQAAWTTGLDLRMVSDTAHAAGATVNDVLVAALTGGLRGYLRHRGSLVDHIRVFLPFNLRPLDQPLASTLGNEFGLVMATLPVGVPDARGRLEAVMREMSDIKTSADGPVSYGILSLTGMTPLEIERLIVDVFTARGSAVLTNVPGPRQPVYMAGSEVGGVLVWAPMSGSVSMSLTIMSYNGSISLGVMADSGLVPDPERIIAGFERELDELRRLYLPTGPAVTPVRG